MAHPYHPPIEVIPPPVILVSLRLSSVYAFFPSFNALPNYRHGSKDVYVKYQNRKKINKKELRINSQQQQHNNCVDKRKLTR